MAAIRNFIERIRTRNRPNFLRTSLLVGGWDGLTCLPFGELVFQNIVELLTDLNNDVEWVNAGGKGNMTFAEFVRFFQTEGESVLWMVYRYGYAVIGIKWDDKTMAATKIRLLESNEYVEKSTANGVTIEAVDKEWKVYVMKSQTYQVKCASDWTVCRPAIEFLDNTMNASNTSVRKLGAFIVATPETPNSAPAAVKLNPDDKKEMEDEIAKEYGLLSKQRQVMLLPRGMKFSTVSLTSIDNRLTERVRLNVELVADRLKVPASQISVVDASAGKSLSNGGEVHEGDRLKYKTYERLLNKTFVAFAEGLGLKVTYNIYNKPADAVTGQISELG